jgi:hypothetical protein
VDVRIGIVDSTKELEVELPDDVDRDAVIDEIAGLLGAGDAGLVRLTDRKGRLFAVPVRRIAYVEVGAPAAQRRVGFGTP